MCHISYTHIFSGRTSVFPPPPQHPAPEGRWGKFATIASTSEVCYSIFFWNVHHFRIRPPHIRPAPLMSS
ncbi:BZ3500_MvSof-1268-A1-R1_Chr11-2g03343 [Microbotryum saponariae]|uniref:BZ3500_MvSof-1268-A1-R1_Chr11-2g03343 protein n=1 Tax=Microbotryum saponariae TaxID=289078 RepID=A0A2X0ND58_9BASI|nr:BZ3500_MvSof-1268-A1-R1_Chr11-2g03343 [Microbotryum saponariae]SDA03166.1 BZ3501_MvSof-1269-A2-R1_Chr11g02914 [Microbotryum saponariae]